MDILGILVIWFESQVEIYLMIFEMHISTRNTMPDVTKASVYFVCRLCVHGKVNYSINFPGYSY